MANTPVIDQFMASIKPIAEQLGLSTLVVAAQDPTTNEMKLFGSREAKEVLRDLVSEKFGFGSEVGWGDQS